MQASKLVLSAVLAVSLSSFASAQSPLQRAVDRAARSETLGTAAWGMKAVDGKGRVLAQYRSETKLNPASNMKLITTGCALHSLGKDFRFETSIGYSGAIVDGVLEGDLYIIGGGDPTLATADSVVLKTDALFWKWKSAVKAAGIRAIHGRIIGDGRMFEGYLEHGSWEYEDIGTYYAPGGSALSFYANAQEYEVRAGAAPGDPVPVNITYPETPWLHFENRGVTGPEGTGNSLYLYTTDLSPFAELRGTFAIGRRPKTERFANKYGALTCAYYFWKNLKDTGWEVSGGYADIDRSGRIRDGRDFSSGEKAAEKPKIIITTYSPTLDVISRETLGRSDNFYAEAILRAMGERSSGISVYDSCRVAEAEVLEDLSPGLSSMIDIMDGSGLSRHNYVSPEALVRYLTAMEKSPAFPSLTWALPYPGGNGTLKRLLPNLPAETRQRIRMKSGTIGGGLCYSGYILPPEGSEDAPVVFSIMTNNCTAPVESVRSTIMGLITALVQTTEQ